MKITFAAYEHSTIGFPGVILKWTVENDKISENYIVINDIIQTSNWIWYNKYSMPFIDFELGRFDEWVRKNFSDNISVQG